MDTAKTRAILQEHIRLCSDLHELFLEEGQLMRSTGTAPDGEFLERKGQFVDVLDKGLQLLREINASGAPLPRSLQPLVEECRDKLMKLMMIDRENERLLLKTSLPPKMKQAYAKVAPGQLARVYEKYSS